MLGILLKLLLPAAVLYMVLWAMKNTLLPPDSESERFDKKNDSESDEDVIDICPQCGNVQKPGHKCS